VPPQLAGNDTGGVNLSNLHQVKIRILRVHYPDQPNQVDIQVFGVQPPLPFTCGISQKQPGGNVARSC